MMWSKERKRVKERKIYIIIFPWLFSYLLFLNKLPLLDLLCLMHIFYNNTRCIFIMSHGENHAVLILGRILYHQFSSNQTRLNVVYWYFSFIVMLKLYDQYVLLFLQMKHNVFSIYLVNILKPVLFFMVKRMFVMEYSKLCCFLKIRDVVSSYLWFVEILFLQAFYPEILVSFSIIIYQCIVYSNYGMTLLMIHFLTLKMTRLISLSAYINKLFIFYFLFLFIFSDRYQSNKKP